jgi:hypothetical protein
MMTREEFEQLGFDGGERLRKFLAAELLIALGIYSPDEDHQGRRIERVAAALDGIIHRWPSRS